MTSVSTSNWLDRLRSSRGFPTGTEPDLDRFLSTTTSSSANSATATRSESTHGSTRPQHDEEEEKQWLIPNILSELFNMGSPSRTFSKKTKTSRKQSNPRFFNGNEMCSSSGDNNNNNNNSNDNNNNITINSNVDEREQEQQEQGDDDDDDDDDDEDGDLKAYSRSDVMVIDTSLPNWKFDGWVFRKNDEWKIKEKKRYFNGGKSKKKKKKRELLLNEDHKNNSKDKAKSLIDKKVEPFKEAADNLSKAPQKKFPCPRPPEKFPKEGSSVILLKSIPLNNVYDGTTKLGKSARKKPPVKMKIV